jgi:hypothetical protein
VLQLGKNMVPLCCRGTTDMLRIKTLLTHPASRPKGEADVGRQARRKSSVSPGFALCWPSWSPSVKAAVLGAKTPHQSDTRPKELGHPLSLLCQHAQHNSGLLTKNSRLSRLLLVGHHKVKIKQIVCPLCKDSDGEPQP